MIRLTKIGRVQMDEASEGRGGRPIGYSCLGHSEGRHDVKIATTASHEERRFTLDAAQGRSCEVLGSF